MQQESEEEDEDQEAREQELQRIHAELQKADDRCMRSKIYMKLVDAPPRDPSGQHVGLLGLAEATPPDLSAQLILATLLLANLRLLICREHLNIVFIGHVDAGKSTTGGQILYLTVGVLLDPHHACRGLVSQHQQSQACMNSNMRRISRCSGTVKGCQAGKAGACLLPAQAACAPGILGCHASQEAKRVRATRDTPFNGPLPSTGSPRASTTRPALGQPIDGKADVLKKGRNTRGN